MTAVEGRYVPTGLAATEAERAVLCAHCGVLVAGTAAHDRFHRRVDGLAPRAPKGGTRGG